MRFIIFALIALLVSMSAQARDASEIIKDCDVCPELVVIKSGKFLMGRRPYEPTRQDGKLSRDMPAKEITIAYSFAIGRYELTRSQYQACADAGACEDIYAKPKGSITVRVPNPLTGKPYEPIDPNVYPANRMAWKNGQEYVAWLSKITGETYRVPTESEWEYAARGSTTTLYWWGDEIGEGNAFCRACNRNGDLRSLFSRGQLKPIGSYKPNPFGLHDVIGNASEMTSGCYTETLEDIPADGSAIVNEDCKVLVVRGPSANERSAFRVRISQRAGYSRTRRGQYLSLRVVREIRPPN